MNSAVGVRVAHVMSSPVVAITAEAARSGRVGELVRHGVRSVPPDAAVAEAARIMMAGHCDAVPVVTAAGALIGLVTGTDLVAAVVRGAVEVAGAAGMGE